MPNAHLLVESASFSIQNQDTFETMLGKYTSELSSVLGDYDADVAAIKADKSLSQIGQLEKIQERAARCADFIAELDAKASQIDGEAAKHHEKMTQALDANTWTSGNATNDAIRAGELRAVLRSTDPLERQNIYRQAVATGDAELIQVFETAHSLLGLLPADLIHEQRRIRAGRLAPDAATMAGDLTRLRRTIQGNVGLSRQHVKKHLSPHYGDTLAAVAAGNKE